MVHTTTTTRDSLCKHLRGVCGWSGGWGYSLCPPTHTGDLFSGTDRAEATLAALGSLGQNERRRHQEALISPPFRRSWDASGFFCVCVCCFVFSSPVELWLVAVVGVGGQIAAVFADGGLVVVMVVVVSNS